LSLSKTVLQSDFKKSRISGSFFFSAFFLSFYENRPVLKNRTESRSFQKKLKKSGGGIGANDSFLHGI
jgi:hypothetical protein